MCIQPHQASTKLRAEDEEVKRLHLSTRANYNIMCHLTQFIKSERQRRSGKNDKYLIGMYKGEKKIHEMKNCIVLKFNEPFEAKFKGKIKQGWSQKTLYLLPKQYI